MKKPFVPAPISSLEEDLLKAKDLLHSGLDASLAKVSEAAERAGGLMKDDVKAKLKKLELLGEEAIDQIERSVGELNYLAGEGDITDIEAFDRLAAPISQSIHGARDALGKLDEEGRRELGELSGRLGAAWRDLHLSLEMVRLNLAVTESSTGKECADLRAKLVGEFEAAAAAAKEANEKQEHSTLLARLLDGIRSQVKGVSETLHTLFPT